MLNNELVAQLLEEARRIEKERAQFIAEADFYAIRDNLFSFVMTNDHKDDTVLAMSPGTAAQLVEYIERTEELIPAIALLTYALAFGTVLPGWVPRSSSPYKLAGVPHGTHH